MYKIMAVIFFYFIFQLCDFNCKPRRAPSCLRKVDWQRCCSRAGAVCGSKQLVSEGSLISALVVVSSTGQVLVSLLTWHSLWGEQEYEDVGNNSSAPCSSSVVAGSVTALQRKKVVHHSQWQQCCSRQLGSCPAT